MRLVGDETCPLPEDPALAEVAQALNASRSWGYVVDDDWCLAYMTDDIRLSNGRLRELVPFFLGAWYFSREALDIALGWSGGVFSIDAYRHSLRGVGPWVLTDTAGGRNALRDRVHPELRDVVDELEEVQTPAALTFVMPGMYAPGGDPLDVFVTAWRVHDASGRLAGTAHVAKPAAGMSVLGTLASAGDLRHFERMQTVARSARHPAAILFADLEGSSPLARRLSTSSYFALGRRLVRAADACVVDAGGIVGRHVGDGVVSFFLAEHAGSESAAAGACITAARDLRERLGAVAVRSGLEPQDVVLRFGLHWGSTLHVGQITTPGRAEVNALGDEVNEAARIEACATGGRTLASKALIERLEPEAAEALGIDPARITYTALGDLSTATEKARRDAPAIAVCDV